jgi:hypothetical protein
MMNEVYPEHVDLARTIVELRMMTQTSAFRSLAKKGVNYRSTAAFNDDILSIFPIPKRPPNITKLSITYPAPTIISNVQLCITTFRITRYKASEITHDLVQRLDSSSPNIELSEQVSLLITNVKSPGI